MEHLSRNDTLGFAARARTNLLHIEVARQKGDDVHVITQVVLSALGLIVLPWERKVLDRLETLRISDLEADGWPRWHFTLGDTETLQDLIRHLRNAIAHGRIKFSSESRASEEVVLHVEDGPKGKPASWKAHIGARELRDFCLKFMELMEDTIG